MSNVFVIWGKNHRLAAQVQKQLMECGYNATVGGDENSADNFRSHYLGPRVVEQMNTADRAIILVQWPPEDKPDADMRDFSLRPNLLFEWGFMLSRFQKQPYLHVFLIGIAREQLPTDLQGYFIQHVLPWNPHTGSVAETATSIVSLFIKDIASERVDPLEPFRDWPGWRAKLMSAQGSDDTLAVSLLHSIQPGFYIWELDAVREAAGQLARRTPLSPQLARACAVTNAACDYYALTGANNRSQNFAKLSTIRNQLLVADSSPSSLKNDFSWTEVVRLDFLGIVCRRLAIATDDKLQAQDSRAFLRGAQDALQEVLGILDNLPEAQRYGAYHLWRAYALRNIGRVYAELGDQAAGKVATEQALATWRRALGDISDSRIPEVIRAQVAFEVVLLELDLAKHQDLNGAQAVMRNVVRILRDGTPKSLMWRKTIEQAQTLATRLGQPDLTTELDRLAADLAAK